MGSICSPTESSCAWAPGAGIAAPHCPASHAAEPWPGKPGLPGQGYLASMLCPTARASHQCSPSEMPEGPFVGKNEWEAGGRGGSTRTHRWTLLYWLSMLAMSLERGGSQQSIPWKEGQPSSALLARLGSLADTSAQLSPALPSSPPADIC